MSDEARERELAALRERAYGREADIASDPLALSRLRELEGAISEGAMSDSPIRREGLPIVDASHGREAGTSEPVPVAEADETDVDDPVVAKGVGKRLLWAWAVSLVAVAVAASVITAALTSGEATPYATLSILPAAEVPASALQGLNESDAVRYTDFYGVILASGVSDFSRGEDRMCLIVLTDGAATSGEGTYGACAAPGLNPVLDYVVDGFSSEQLRAVFASGTPLRFALNGDRIDVYVGDQPEV
ncbi:hypothetical protein FHX48_002488 [Microbacterium halimionae]|uniref:Uncharacterized protein n=1 Tax=Microbacterium halimionae TaxID=1526413 RepID=A0A7W3JQX5_9MICO|nr:hypothetical protein [Microbacterium halimionae]MBA8817389.1 hypothetical protein [Microbacterium halimionae]NII96023.1 hypothetical protein [Microbacterium halimionae]